MSLQLVAQHIAQKGRGPDSTLVHMSNKEVAGLQALAQKHGGQLSVNPETGLPEAGFLDSILPAVAGFGISAVTGLDPITAGAIVGGITALDSKDLSKGLTAGLGAWGGAGMAGGLATLGGAESLATATPAQYGAGYDAFTKAPMASLSTLGGGSAIKGSLPILAGLAPVAADMYDTPDEEEDKPPEQKKGYIRKYALDPVTGQYKQVGVYEAGGDPNKDVTSEAGTAGSYGAVAKSDYEKAQGMAAGGTASDSERIYDYLMGRGPNPMQFTHTTAPQVDYSPYMPKPNVPITPTTGILESPFDQYGNIKTTGNNQSQEQRDQREADFNAPNEYLGGISKNDYFSLSPEARAEVDRKSAEDHPIASRMGEAVKTLLIPGGIGLKALSDIYNKFVPPPLVPPSSDMTYPSDQAVMYDGTQSVNPELQKVIAGQPSIYDKGLMGVNTTPRTEATVWKDASGNTWQTGDKSPLMTGYGASILKQQETGRRVASSESMGDTTGKATPEGLAALRDATDRANAAQRAAEIARVTDSMPNTPPPGTVDTGFHDALMNAFQSNFPNTPPPGTVPQSNEPQGGEPQGGEPQGGEPQGGDDNHFAGNGDGDGGGGNTAAHGGYLQQGQFNHMARGGGVHGSLRPPQPFYEGGKYSYKPPQVYADGGGIADLAGRYNLGSYSDGGRLLKGPGDGVSDNIPATIGHGQPARLADGEFVIPARIVSEIGNGSTDAGARELYKMMDRIQAGRKQTVGKDQVAKNSKAVRHLPA